MANQTAIQRIIGAASKPVKTGAPIFKTDTRRAVPALVLGAIGAFVFRKKHPFLGALGGLALGDAIDPILNRPTQRTGAIVSLVTVGAGTIAALKWKRHPAIGYIAASALLAAACNGVGLPTGVDDGIDAGRDAGRGDGGTSINTSPYPDGGKPFPSWPGNSSDLAQTDGGQ